MSSDKETDEARYPGPEDGIVVAINDPKKLRRVKVRVPGIIEQSDWVLPLGGGSAQRGGGRVPPIGADVVVWFHRGDPHGKAWYVPGNWGEPGGKSEAPTSVMDAGVAPEDAADVTPFETATYLITIDDRKGKRAITILDKVSRDTIVIDGNKRRLTMNVSGTLALNVGALIVKAARIVLNERVVAAFGGPI